ncbi:unnamed protein product, partial [Phaeothamnion confervicola]
MAAVAAVHGAGVDIEAQEGVEPAPPSLAATASSTAPRRARHCLGNACLYRNYLARAEFNLAGILLSLVFLTVKLEDGPVSWYAVMLPAAISYAGLFCAHAAEGAFPGSSVAAIAAAAVRSRWQPAQDALHALSIALTLVVLSLYLSGAIPSSTGIGLLLTPVWLNSAANTALFLASPPPARLAGNPEARERWARSQLNKLRAHLLCYVLQGALVACKVDGVLASSSWASILWPTWVAYLLVGSTLLGATIALCMGLQQNHRGLVGPIVGTILAFWAMFMCSLCSLVLFVRRMDNARSTISPTAILAPMIAAVALWMALMPSIA